MTELFNGSDPLGPIASQESEGTFKESADPVKGDRVTVSKSELKNNGVSDEYLSNLRVPIGLALGRNNPEEISISIAAELLEEGGQ